MRQAKAASDNHQTIKGKIPSGVEFSDSTKGESALDIIVIVSFCRVQRPREDPESVPPDKVGGRRS